MERLSLRSIHAFRDTCGAIILNNISTALHASDLGTIHTIEHLSKSKNDTLVGIKGTNKCGTLVVSAGTHFATQELSHMVTCCLHVLHLFSSQSKTLVPACGYTEWQFAQFIRTNVTKLAFGPLLRAKLEHQLMQMAHQFEMLALRIMCGKSSTEQAIFAKPHIFKSLLDNTYHVFDMQTETAMCIVTQTISNNSRPNRVELALVKRETYLAAMNLAHLTSKLVP